MLSVNLYQINGFLYRLSDEDLKEGDLVYNVVDNTYGNIHGINHKHVSIKYEGIIETASKTSVFKLIPAAINN